MLTNRKYTVLFTFLISLIVCLPILHRTESTRIVFDMVLTAVFLVMMLFIFNRGTIRPVALLLGVPTLIGLWCGRLLDGSAEMPLAVVYHFFAAAFFGMSTVVILTDTRGQKMVTTDFVFGVFAGYVLLGLLFGHLTTMVEWLEPGSYQGVGSDNHSPETRHFVLTYFSFITLTTVGYGDITPATNTARGLAVIEAILGQFYLAVLVAELISRWSTQIPSSDEPR